MKQGNKVLILGSNTTKLGTHDKDDCYKEIKLFIIVHVYNKIDVYL